MGFAQQRPAARHHGPPVLTARASCHASVRSILGNMIGDIELDGGPMSALGQKRAFLPVRMMSPKADIDRNHFRSGMSALVTLWIFQCARRSPPGFFKLSEMLSRAA